MKKHRHRWSIAAALFVVVSCTLAAAAQNARHRAPNILLILVDDVGYADVGLFSARIHQTTPDKLYYETPRIDQLGRQGTLFTQFYGKMGYKGFHNFATWATLRQGDYKLHYDYQGKVELYNIARDMFEKHDLVTEKPRLAHDLLVQLTDWLRANCNEAYLPSPNVQFNPHGELPYGPYVPLEQLKAMLLNESRSVH